MGDKVSVGISTRGSVATGTGVSVGISVETSVGVSEGRVIFGVSVNVAVGMNIKGVVGEGTILAQGGT